MSQSRIDEILEVLGYKKQKCEEEEYASIGEKTNCCNNFDLDIINGFQDVNPILFITVGELIGDIMSGQMPANVANLVANFLNLVGQIIETYSSQQAYFQNGPGRYYNPIYKNVNNPFCSCVSDNVTKKEFLKFKEEINKKLDVLSKKIK